MIARLVRSADFERVLRVRTRFNSGHFALHHLADAPGRAQGTAPENDDLGPAARELSTGAASGRIEAVDDSAIRLGSRLWLGAVVPKRHARRSVTRTLLKRQIRAVATRFVGALPSGVWVVRLRAPFDRKLFPSAASDHLRMSARVELEGLFDGAVRRLTQG